MAKKRAKRTLAEEILHCDVMLSKWSLRSKLVATYTRKWLRRKRQLQNKLAADLRNASANIKESFPARGAEKPKPKPKRRITL